MAQDQYLETFAGENRTLSLQARDSANNPVNLTGLTVTWGLAYPPYAPEWYTPLVQKTGTVTSASGGLFTVALLPSDTAAFPSGNYIHQAWTTDSSGNIAVVTIGTIKVRPTLLPIV